MKARRANSPTMLLKDRGSCRHLVGSSGGGEFAGDSPLEGEGFEPSVPRRGQHFSRLPRSSFWETAGWFRRCRDSKTTSCSAAGPLMKADPRRAWEEELR
jgi:hypothetical protein